MRVYSLILLTLWSTEGVGKELHVILQGKEKIQTAARLTQYLYLRWLEDRKRWRRKAGHVTTSNCSSRKEEKEYLLA